MIQLDLYSDPICPWCYIGWTWLSRAMESTPDQPFDLRWRPFQLNLGMPKNGMERAAYLEAKFGGQSGAVQAYAPILKTAQEAGLNIDFAAIERTPNTLDAHRLIHWAGLEGCQTPVAASLFRAYFNQARDIGDANVLAEIGETAGMDRAMLLRLLESDADKAEIRAQDKAARDMGVTAVPTFILARHYVLNGAQRPEQWQKIMAEITAAGPAPETEKNGPTC